MLLWHFVNFKLNFFIIDFLKKPIWLEIFDSLQKQCNSTIFIILECRKEREERKRKKGREKERKKEGWERKI